MKNLQLMQNALKTVETNLQKMEELYNLVAKQYQDYSIEKILVAIHDKIAALSSEKSNLTRERDKILASCQFRTCIECKLFVIETQTVAYSEYTPGSDFWIRCVKKFYNISGYELTESKFRETLLKGLTCRFFTPRNLTQDK